jgi:hypothetical protein
VAAPISLSDPREYAARLPPGPGVYRFRDAAGGVLYLGRSVSLRRRVASYWGDLGDRGHLAAMVARIARVEAVPCDSAHEAAWLERNLLERRKPPWNRSPSGGQESEVWIRLSESAPAPGVMVVRRRRTGDRARHFGPYLRGQKAQAEPSDFDVAGWADGVLVCFAIRGGRLCRWSQRACGAAAARRHLAQTPGPGPRAPAWADFARRSAELAARLR